MRILQLADYGGPYAGSFVPMLRAAAAEGRRRGHETEIVFTPVARDRPWLDELHADAISVTFASGRGRRDLASAVAAVLPAGSEPAVLHSHFTAFDLASRSVGRRRAATAVVWHVHTPLRADARGRTANVVKYSLLGRGVDRIVAVAPHIATAVRRRGAPADRVTALANAVDVERLPSRSRERSLRARSRLGLPAERPVLLHFGWDWKRKGGELLVGAVRRLADQGVPVIVASVGSGDHAREAAAALGVSDSVGVIEPTGDVATLYAAADVFVTCSRAEGMPYSLLEAVASGVAVVATAIPGQQEIATRAPGCRLVGLDAEEIAAGVRDLLVRDASRTDADAASAREWARQHVDIRPWAERLVDLYEAVAGGHAT